MLQQHFTLFDVFLFRNLAVSYLMDHYRMCDSSLVQIFKTDLSIFFFQRLVSKMTNRSEDILASYLACMHK